MSNKKRGRPALPVSQRQTYKRLAVYPETHKRIVKNAKAKGEHIIDYVDNVVPIKEK